MPTSSYMPKDDSGKADLLDHLFSFHPALRGEKKILQIIGSAYIIDPSTWKPVLSILMQAGHPTIVWAKGKASALELWVDRNDGNGFVFLIIHTEPNTPTSPRSRPPEPVWYGSTKPSTTTMTSK